MEEVDICLLEPFEDEKKSDMKINIFRERGWAELDLNLPIEYFP